MKKIVDNIEEYICAICLAIMTILTFANVISRYVFSASFSFSEEITTYLFVLLSLLGSAIAAKRSAHLGFTLLGDLVKPGINRIFKIIGYLFAVAFCVLLFYHGMLMVISQIQYQQVTAGMQWPEWIFGSFVPFGTFFVTIRFVQLLITECKRKAV